MGFTTQCFIHKNTANIRNRLKELGYYCNPYLGWHKALGIILFVFAMAVYNIGEYAKGYKHGFDDGLKECLEIIKKNGKNRADSNN